MGRLLNRFQHHPKIKMKYENSTMKNEYKYLYKKDDELKGNNITVENEGIVEYGNDFLNCKIILSKQ